MAHMVFSPAPRCRKLTIEFFSALCDPNQIFWRRERATLRQCATDFHFDLLICLNVGLSEIRHAIHFTPDMRSGPQVSQLLASKSTSRLTESGSRANWRLKC